jgi:hypothetical protein
MILTLCMKLGQGSLTPAIKASLVKSVPKYLIRTFGDDARSTFQRVSRRRTLRERAMAPAADTGKENKYSSDISSRFCIYL